MKLYLKTGKDRSVRMGNPWIFSGAVAFTRGELEERNLCSVYDNRGTLLGVGYYNAKSAICVRMLTIAPSDSPESFDSFDPTARGRARALSFSSSCYPKLFDGTAKDDDLFEDDEPSSPGAAPDESPSGAPLTFTDDDLRERIRRAADQRADCGILSGETNACRLVNSEGDFLPGLIVDRYGQGLCIQIGTAGMEVWRDEIVAALDDILQPAFIYERSATESRKREGLPCSDGLALGELPNPLSIMENGVEYRINLGEGQKTGFFLDQRDNRALVRRYSAGRPVCDCFSYSGGFALNAALGGAVSVRAIDSSADAGAALAENARLNGTDIEFIREDAFDYLRQPQPETGLVILDPPKFARHPGETDKAARGYKDINLAAMKMLSPGGILFTFSCSGAVGPYLFRQIVYSAAADAKRQVQVLHVLSAGSDHPVNIAHKEGEYLKGLVLRVY